MTVQARRRLFAAALITPAFFITGAMGVKTDDNHHEPPAPVPAAKPTPGGSKKAPSTPATDAKRDSHATKPAHADKPSHGDEPATKAEPKPTSKPKPERHEDPTTAAGALKMLQDGNQRWVMDKEENPATDSSRRSTLADRGQKPFATILTCADSRMPVERLFDRGVGDLFVVRVAGNVAGTSETGTIEYGVEHLKTPLLVVMGHTKCGAVAAAASGAELHGSLGELVAAIGPAVDRARRNNPEADAKQIAPIAVKENVWQSITDLLRRSPEVRSAVAKKNLTVVGAVCDISTGKVDWMGEHPWQSELVEAFNSRTPGQIARPTEDSAPKSVDASKGDEH